MRKFLILFSAVLVIAGSFFFGIYKVEGSSMEPRIEEGSLVIVRKKVLIWSSTAVDDLVIFRNPLTKKLNIKLCTAVDDGRIFVIGENLPESTDSRHFGSIDESDVQGWVWIKI